MNFNNAGNITNANSDSYNNSSPVDRSNQNSYFERDSRVRRTAENVGKRFDDIKKRYASGPSSQQVPVPVHGGYGSNSNVFGRPVPTSASSGASVGAGGGVDLSGSTTTNPKDCKESQGNYVPPTTGNSFTDMIASKRELFFKQHGSSSSSAILPPNNLNHHHQSLSSASHYVNNDSTAAQSRQQQQYPANYHYNNNTGNNRYEPSPPGNSSPPYHNNNNQQQNFGAMPIPSSSSTSSSAAAANVSSAQAAAAAAAAAGKGAAYDYSDRDKPLSSYISGAGPSVNRFASSKPSFRQQAHNTAAGDDGDDDSKVRGQVTASPPPTIMAASVSSGAGVKTHHHHSNGHVTLPVPTAGSHVNVTNGVPQPGQQPPTAVVERCIGFANLPNQFYRRAVKRGFEFTLMVVGESGLGKSTLINSLFLSDIYSDEHPGPSQRFKKTVDVETSKQILVENGVQLALTIVDTPGFGDSVDNSECWQKILDHIENKYEEYLNAESRVNRVTVPDSRIHCCLYFIAPSGHGLKSLDIEFMKKLHDKVNILPLISKADTMMPEEIVKFKKRILSEIKQHNINIYEFPLPDDPEDNKRNKELRDRVPFAIMGSNVIYDVSNRKVRGRKYPWGIAEVENPDHCDFLALRDMLIRRHMQNMKDVTNHILYENYRRQKLSGGNPNKITADNPMAQLEEERKEQEENLRKTEQEMEQVFATKVKEKEQKIKESKLELEKRYEQMKKNLEEQMRELEERRKNFELERQAWEGGGHPLTASHSSSAVSLNGNVLSTSSSNVLSNGASEYGASNGNTPNNQVSHPYNGTTNSLQSLNSNTKKGHMYTDASIKEVYDEKEKKKEKKRFF